LTKKDIAKEIAAKYGLDQTVAKRTVQDVFDHIVESLLTNGRIELRNFGVFELKHRAPRVARNPRTNQQVSVPPRTVVVFHPGKNLSKMVSEKVQTGGQAPPTQGPDASQAGAGERQDLPATQLNP
jgi:integration host factor subunit beta